MEVWFVTPSLDFSTTRPIFMTWLIIGFWKKDKIELIMMGGLLKCILGVIMGGRGLLHIIHISLSPFFCTLFIVLSIWCTFNAFLLPLIHSKTSFGLPYHVCNNLIKWLYYIDGCYLAFKIVTYYLCMHIC